MIACPRPISWEYSGRTVIEWPIFDNLRKVTSGTRDSIATSHPEHPPLKNHDASIAYWMFMP